MGQIEQQFFNDLEKKLWTATDKLRSNLDAAELEVRDYYTEKNVFWVPLEARWQTLQDCAQLPPKAPLPWNTKARLERTWRGWGIHYDYE